jgi:hypothetical protein
MAKEQKKTVSFRVDRGIRINGASIFPSKDAKKPVIITLPENFAKELAYASKGEIVDNKANTKIAEAPSEEDDLDAAFGADEEKE